MGMSRDWRSEEGFTLLEMVAVIALIGVFASLVAVRLDVFGRDSKRELRRFRTFVKQQHSLAIKRGSTRRLRFLPGRGVVKVLSGSGGSPTAFQFTDWTLDHDRQFTLLLTPVGVQGPSTVKLKRGTKTHVFKRDRLMGLVRAETSRDDR